MIPTKAAFSGQGLYFSFAEMNIEIESMKKLASRFLDEKTSQWILPAWQKDLKSYQKSGTGKAHEWAIQQAAPFTTKFSDGKYEPDGKGGHIIFGELSAVWEIQVVELERKKKAELPPLFSLVGNASTKVRICKFNDTGVPIELARWRFEVGDARSPGCHFHVQVLGGEADTVFPKSLPVPRLPGLMVTPMDGLEFLLGEIFQEEWRREVSKSSTAITSWAGGQRKRLTKLLEWQKEHLERSNGSPWTWLKGQKPQADLLMKD
jgi:hypothetical protein